MWSIGVIVFLLLVGYLPIMEESQSSLFAKIRVGKWKFQEEDWKHISKDAQDFVKNCLDVDPEQRWTAGEALKSAWICSSGEGTNIGDITTSLDELRKRRSKLRKFTTPVIWESDGDTIGEPTSDEKTIEEDE